MQFYSYWLNLLVFETSLEEKWEGIYLRDLFKIFPKASLLATDSLNVYVGMFILSLFLFLILAVLGRHGAHSLSSCGTQGIF